MPEPRYTRTAIGLHWVVALLIFVNFALGLYMVELLLSPTKLKLYSWHKWVGMSMLALAIVRIAWRATHAAPPLPGTMPPWERTVAGATHLLIYVLLVAIPVTGWLFSSASGFKVVYLGMLPLPDLVAKDKALADFLQWLHRTLNYSLAVLVAGHVAAALKHHFLERDGVLARMLPFLDNQKGTRGNP